MLFRRQHVGSIGVVQALGAWSKMQQLLRWAAMVAVIFGVALMHSLPLAHPAGGHTPTAAHTSSLEHSHAAPAADTPRTDPALAGTLCQGDCRTHPVLHMCVAIVTIAAALVVATWLLAYSSADDRRGQGRSAWLRSHASRAPPWTTPTLAQLSVLRV